MRRREFITLISSAVASRPLAAFGQRGERVRRIGVLIPFQADPETQALLAAFKQRFKELGWTEGGNVHIDYRFTDGNPERTRAASAELVGLSPDVILAYANPAVSSLMQVTQSIPIVFTQASDPVGSGFVSNLAHPGGNITGLAASSNDTAPKQLELLAMIAPSASRIGILGNPNNPNFASVLKNAQVAGERAGLFITPVAAGNVEEIERAFAAFDKQGIQGVIATTDAVFFAQREHIAELALAKRLPTMFSQREYVEAGGLMSYGASSIDAYRQAGIYVGRILKGEKPADLPIVQATKFELVINLKTAKALGLNVPTSMQLLADEMIE